MTEGHSPSAGPMHWRAGLVFLLALTVGGATAGGQQGEPTAFDRGRTLQKQGKPEQAFLTYAAAPGTAHLAVQLARPKARHYLDVLRARAGDAPRPLVKLVEGDLLLAVGRKAEALKCYRQAAGGIGKAEGDGWAKGLVPPGSYVVEPPGAPGSAYRRPAEAFTLGPGSHRDNWLIRRFIALGAEADAAGEFARIWPLHRRRSRPHVILTPVHEGGKVVGHDRRLVAPAGFDALGLQFAIDYAYFLKRAKQTDKALAVLLEPLLAVDMDRNPNRIGPGEAISDEAAAKYPLLVGGARGRYHYWLVPAGVSRKEFIRLAYGAFKQPGQEEQLVADLRKRISDGDNRLRRVLARVRLHQGKVDEALALELAYIDKAGFDPLSAACRRGRAYEDCHQLAEAAEAYEKALSLPYAPPRLPDADEEAAQRAMFAQSSRPMRAAADTPAGRTHFHAGIVRRLQRLYGALGKADKARTMALRQFEANPALMADLRSLEQSARQFRAADKDKQFRDWAAAQAGRAKDPMARANLYWLIDDRKACAQALAQWRKQTKQPSQALQQWRDRFAKAGRDDFRVLLNALLAAEPADAVSRLELLDLEDRFEGEEVIRVLELLLESPPGQLFAVTKVSRNRTRFRNHHDLAYRLMRLYERNGHLDKLRALGMRVAGGKKPFGPWWKTELAPYRHRHENDLPEDLNGCLSLLIHHADAATLGRLEAAWRDHEDHPGKRQFARRKAGRLEGPAKGKAFGWADQPKGVTLIASNENVLSLARDDKHVYAGHPWGLAVYDLEGKPVVRVALGDAAMALAAADGAVWAGTPKGLYRIKREDWSVGHLWLHGDVPDEDRYVRREPNKPGNYWFDNGVYALALDGQALWIGLHRNVQRLDLATMELRAYSCEELRTTSRVGYSRILPEKDHVWADSPHSGLRRYDRKTDTWDAVQYDGRDVVHLIGAVEGRLFGHVHLGEPLRNRPCLIDRRTLKVTPLLIEADLSRDARCINGPFAWYGTYHGKLVFGPGWPAYVYDEKLNKLRPMPANWNQQADPITGPIPAGLRSGRPWRAGDGVVTCYDDQTHAHIVFGRSFYTGWWLLLRLPDGAVVLGGKHPDSPRYEYAEGGAVFSAMPREKRRGSGGLYFVSPEGRARRVSAGGGPDGIRGERVFDVVADPQGKRTWLCTDHGLAVLDAAGQVTAEVTRRDGLCANRVLAGAAMGRRLYFAAARGDRGGGLAVFDPATAVFAARFDSDGLATNKLKAVRPEGKLLKLTYGVEYGRGRPFRYRLFPPGTFDPATGAVHPGGAAREMNQTEAHKILRSWNGQPRPMPYLGGRIIAERTFGGKTYLCGTRGLAIVEGPRWPRLKVAALKAKVIADPAIQLKAQARRTRISVSTAGDLHRCAASDNQHLRLRALRMAEWTALKSPHDFLPVLATMAADEYAPVREEAVALLGKLGSPDALPAAKAALKDKDYRVRRAAALALARLGQPPDLEHFDAVLRREGNSYYSRLDIYRALAGHADAETFKFFLKYPLPADSYDDRQKVFAELGKALRKRPAAAAVLLAAYDDPNEYRRARFAREVFRHAGKAMLPRLHKALGSDDRVVRSNAARACGAVGDPSSVRPLIAALDLESGLSRASIVWALGELKANEALPLLVKLYVDARNDEKRRRGSGFRAAQAQAAIRSQYNSFSNLDALGSEWDELKMAAEPQPIDPRRHEELLTPRHVLEAVAKIGPASAQAFYRKLAGETDSEGRREAARRLGECDKHDQEKNLPILRNLLADPQVLVSMEAAVSLLILDETPARRPILAWLSPAGRWEKHRILDALMRVRDAGQLAFARKQLQAVAADETLDSHYRRWAGKMLAPPENR